MNRISHKQAIKWIHRRLDGLLNENQLSLLDEHLSSCESCRAYAAHMDSLSAHLQNEFHARWDEQSGPSQRVIEDITSKARKIPMTNRISSGLRLFAGAATLLAMAFLINLVFSRLQSTSTAAIATETSQVGEDTSTPGSTQFSGELIAFASSQSGNSDIYIMHADGSGLTNLTNNPAEDTWPVWSPDGKQLAFVSDRNGKEDIYMMTVDGSNLTRLTDDPASDMIPIWSPDSAKIAYVSQDPTANTSSIHIVDLAGQNRRRLSENMPGPVLAWPEAWSPDGQYIFFHSNRQITKVNVNSGETTSVTPQEDIPSQFALTRDGSTLLYLDLCTTNTFDFCNGLNRVHVDGTNAETYATLKLQHLCGSEDASPTATIVHSELIKWSPDRTKILFAFYCEGKGGLFYLANADGSDFKPLTDYPILYEVAGFDWSPDSQSVIFSSALDNAQSDSPYLLNIDEVLQNPSLRPTRLNTSASQISFLAWQPTSNREVVEENPRPVVTTLPSLQAENRLLAFASYQNGNFDIYTMHADGSGLTKLTNHSADDISPFWSPDGKQIAFVSDREGSMQIYLMDADGSNVIQLSDGKGDYLFDINGYTPWSPNGKKLLFLHSSSEKKNYMLYSMDIDGKSKTVLMNEPGVYLHPSWSPDGEHVAFEYHKSEVGAIVPQLFVVDKNGNNLREITGPLGRNGSVPFLLDYYWSQDGTSIFLMAGTQETFDVYKVGLDGSMTVMTKSRRLIIDWWNGVTLQTNENGSSLNWLRSDGSKSALEVCPNGDLWHDQALGVAHKRSHSGNLVFGSSCSASSGWMLYWANPDGTLTDKLLNSPISGENLSLFHMTWSPDDRFFAFVALDNSPELTDTLYVLDIAQARKDPSVQPLNMTGSYSPSWQPTP